MALGARRAFDELTTGAEHDHWLSLPFIGCDGLPKSGQAAVRRGLLEATVVIPANVIQFSTPIWEFLYYKILVNINASIFSLLAFFIASAAYRAFKARSLESTILLVAGLLVVLGQAPVADLLWPGFSIIRDWILAFPNTAGQRGILIGAALGIVVFSVKRLFRYSW
jgi:hypothetical protein